MINTQDEAGLVSLILFLACTGKSLNAANFLRSGEGNELKRIRPYLNIFLRRFMCLEICLLNIK